MSNWDDNSGDDFNFEDSSSVDSDGGSVSVDGERSLSTVRRILIVVFGIIFILLVVVVVIKLTGRHDKVSSGTSSSSSTSYVAKKVQEAKERDSSRSSSSKGKFIEGKSSIGVSESSSSGKGSGGYSDEDSDSDRGYSRSSDRDSDRVSSKDTSDSSSLDSSSIIVSPKVGSDILSNTAVIESIALYSENDLLADFKVKVKMGSTSLEFTESYEVAKDWVVGDKLKVSYSKVDGIDRVVIRGVKHLGS